MPGTLKLVEVDGKTYRATTGIFRITKGWQAGGPKATSLYFADSKHGGTRGALKAAVAWRETVWGGPSPAPALAALSDAVIKGGWAKFKLPEGVTGPHLENRRAVLHVRMPGAKIGEQAKTRSVVIGPECSPERLRAAVAEAAELRRAAVRRMSFA